MAASTEEHTWQKVGENTRKSADSKPPTQPLLRCPECGSKRIWKDGFRYKTITGEPIQRYLCRDCGLRFSETTQGQVKANIPRQVLNPRRNHLRSFCSYSSTRQVCAEAKNLAEVESRIKKRAAGATTPDIKGKLVEYLWYLKKQGYAEGTIKTRTRLLKLLVKQGANLWNPEQVKKVVAEQESWCNGTKRNVKYAYNCFVTMEGLSWEPPRYKRSDKIPFIPLDSEIDLMISASGKTMSIFLLCLKETGADPGEVLRTEWIDLNKQSRTLAINHPVKGHNARILPISKELIGRLELLSKKSERIFPTTMNSMQQNFWKQRKRIVRDFDNPRLDKITFRTYRHWKATTEYHRTKDILFVKHLLGHKTLDSTMVYIDIEKAIYGSGRDDDYTVRVAQTIEEDRELIEAGFEHITDRDDMKLYRKRK